MKQGKGFLKGIEYLCINSTKAIGMTQIYIVRHGETVENLTKILQGHLPGTLTGKGKEQVRHTAEQLAETGVKFSRIVSSDLQRALDSAQIIADRLHLSITPMEMLRERDWGKWTGMSIAEATERFRKNGKWEFPEGTTETEAGIYQRAALALQELPKRYPNETLIVLTHGQFARNLMAAHQKCNYHEVQPFTNAEIRVISL